MIAPSLRGSPLWALWLVLVLSYAIVLTAALAPEALLSAPEPAGPPAPAGRDEPAVALRFDETPEPTATPQPAAEVTQERFYLLRPIPSGYTLTISRFYPYGSTGGGRYQPHHGVEFENPVGTAVMAAGGGKVVYAGWDSLEPVGPTTHFYGLVVVIEHEERYRGEALYTVYAHLNSVAVEEGQRVRAGDLVGTVGATGIALGPHLHFEVRLGESSYEQTRNPELWLQPFRGHGTLAGRVEASGGELWVGLYRPGEGYAYRSVLTYAEDSVAADEELGENFVIGDVPAGEYELRFSWAGQTYREAVTVEPGRLAFVRLGPGR